MCVLQSHKSIGDFLAMFKGHCKSFLPHHERAKWQDEGSAHMRRNIHKYGTVYNPSTERWEPASNELGFCFMTVEDFSNSYTHAPKYEHAGRCGCGLVPRFKHLVSGFSIKSQLHYTLVSYMCH